MHPRTVSVQRQECMHIITENWSRMALREREEEGGEVMGSRKENKTRASTLDDNFRMSDSATLPQSKDPISRGRQRKRETENERGGHRAPGWWQAPPCISFFALLTDNHHHGQQATLVFIHLWGLLSRFVVTFYAASVTSLKSLKTCNTYNIGSGWI